MSKRTKLHTLTKEEREELVRKLYERQGGKCFITGKDINLKTDPVDIDHITALERGGIDDINNYGLTLASWNRSKGIKDLQLQRTLYNFKIDKELYIGPESPNEDRSFTVKDALVKFSGSQREIGVKIDKKTNCVIISYNVKGVSESESYPIITDTNDEKIKSFIALIPKECIYHDPDINPRSIVDLEPFIEEFYNTFPQLQPSLSTLNFEEPEDKAKVFLFDGQHKAAAQLYLGKDKVFVRTFINCDKAKLKKTNARAHTVLAQLHFPQLIADKVGHDIFNDEYEKFLMDSRFEQMPEKDFFETLPDYQETEYKGYFRNYLKYEVVTGELTQEKNKLLGYVETVSSRSKTYPLSYDTLQKAFLNNFLYLRPADDRLEIVKKFRQLERENLIKLMNVFTELVLEGQFNIRKGIYQIEDQLKNDPDSVNINHLKAYRICRQAPMVIWSGQLKEAISTLLGYRRKYERSEWSDARSLWVNLDNSDWENIKKMIYVISQHKVWIEKSQSITPALGSTKQREWKEILLEGKLPGAIEKLYTPLDKNYILEHSK